MSDYRRIAKASVLRASPTTDLLVVQVDVAGGVDRPHGVLCLPSVSRLSFRSELQGLNLRRSSLHSKLEPGSVAEKRSRARVRLVSRFGPLSIAVPGAPPVPAFGSGIVTTTVAARLRVSARLGDRHLERLVALLDGVGEGLHRDRDLLLARSELECLSRLRSLPPAARLLRRAAH